MARRTTVILEDDIDGGPADQQVTFALDGIEFEIDLSESNAAALRGVLEPYVSAGRRTGGRPQHKAAPTRHSSRAQWLSDVRTWARAHGHDVADRGRLSRSVVDAYEAAQA